MGGGGLQGQRELDALHAVASHLLPQTHHAGPLRVRAAQPRPDSGAPGNSHARPCRMAQLGVGAAREISLRKSETCAFESLPREVSASA